MPRLSRVGILANPAHPGEQLELRASRTAAEQLGLTVQYLPVTSSRDFDLAFPALVQKRAQAVVAFPDALVIVRTKLRHVRFVNSRCRQRARPERFGLVC